ncbi:hypothetical protein [Polyangium spumosum]|uniref:Uncharacterized protein n=1 Tax=Polyangium spumosum TaxID=889282 RepID=A0A6N7PQB2_9BACT|nr:hypothetical protein [Polyangium spumosum]MRG92395.1 hypothetical protein [Polyangium spumosum]
MTTARDLARDEADEPASKSGVQATHPLVAAVACAPLDPVTDEEFESLQWILRTADDWIGHEEFVADLGIGP